MAVNYFLLIDGVSGGSVSEGHEGWFEIDFFDFELSNELPAAGGSGAGGGHATFSPLAVNLALAPGISGTLAEIALGGQLAAIKIEGVTADGQTVYELTLTDVSLTEVTDNQLSNVSIDFDSLAFDGYQKLGLITRAQNPDGSLGPADSFGFDLASNTQIDPATLPSPSPGGGIPSTGATQYYLLIDGLTGGSLDDDHQGWFEIDEFTFAVSSEPVVVGGGAAAGPATFSPLGVRLNLNPGLAGALADIALGEQIPAIKFEGVIPGTGETVYELTLTDVSLTGLVDNEGASDFLVFDGYRRIGLITRAQQPNGSLVPADSFGFDRLTNTAIDPASLPSPSAGAALPAASAERYFLVVPGLAGGSPDEDHEGWFEIDGFHFQVSNDPPLLGGGGGGQATFSPLTVDLNLDPGLGGALAAIALGQQLPAIKLAGVTGGGEPRTVYELTLTDVSLTELRDGNIGGDSLTFDYRRIGLITRTQTNTGSLVVADSFGFNRETHAEIDPATLPTPGPGAPPPAASATDYYLSIDGLRGGSLDEDHAGWFDVAFFDFAVTNEPQAGGGAGGGGGKAAFSPLSVRLQLDPGLAGAFAEIALGQQIPAIKIEGVTAGEESQTVYELTLTDVFVTTLLEGDLFFDILSFGGYDKLGLITRAQQPNGSIVVADSFGFDLANNIQIDPATLPSPTPGAPPPAAGATDYYLLIDGITGDSLDDDHAGWFDVDQFSFQVSNEPPAGGGTGSSGGKATFSPLDVRLNLNPGLAGALAGIALGQQLPAIKIEGVTAGEESQTVYELTLSDVFVTELHDDRFTDSISFDGYRELGLITHAQNPNGSIVPAGSFGFDLANNGQINPAILPSPSAGSSLAAASPAQYFLVIHGLTGGSLDENHQGWFGIDGFELGVNYEPPAAGGGGAGGGIATFQPLSVDLSLDPGLAGALTEIALGQVIPAIKIEGVTGGDHPETVYELTLTEVRLTELSERTGFHRLTFDGYQKLGLTTHAQNMSGSTVVADSFGFDLVANMEIDPATLPTPMPGSIFNGTTGADTLNGTDGDDKINALAGDDTINGLGGSDTLNGGPGADAMDGGPGFDVATYVAAGGGISASLSNGSGAGGDAAGDAYTNIEGIMGSNFADVLAGNGNDNMLDGGDGPDTLDGAAGFDTVSYASANAGITSRLDLGFGVGGDGQFDLYAGLEAASGSGFSDVLVGLSGVANTLNGSGGNDVLYGEGLDTVFGGAGNDVFFGGAGGMVTLNLATASIETVWGSVVADVLDGSTASVPLVFIGAGGADAMSGGSGNDFLYYDHLDDISGGVGSDWAVATLSSAGVNLDMNARGFENTWGSPFADVLSGAGSPGTVVIVGDAGNDVITGGDTFDFLYGFGDSDTITGGPGGDIMLGGAGDDIYHYASPNEGFDSIFDFVSGADKFRFAAANFGKSPGDVLVNGTNFLSGAAPVSINPTPTWLYSTGTGILRFDQDGIGAAAPVSIAQIFLAPAVTAADIAFI